MIVIPNRLADYNALPAPARKWVLRMLMYWASWSKSTIYRKMECANLCPMEDLLLSGVLHAARQPQSDGRQLVIGFDWSDGEGKMDIRMEKESRRK